jgi:hypothetical protein
MNPLRYIGKKPKINPDTLLHKAKVVKRKREVCKVQIDVENGCYKKEKQILPKDYIGTHPKRSFWEKVKHLLWQLLP